MYDVSQLWNATVTQVHPKQPYVCIAIASNGGAKRTNYSYTYTCIGALLLRRVPFDSLLLVMLNSHFLCLFQSISVFDRYFVKSAVLYFSQFCF